VRYVKVMERVRSSTGMILHDEIRMAWLAGLLMLELG
jgi:hypothetical protein